MLESATALGSDSKPWFELLKEGVADASAPGQEINIVLNWSQELLERVPVDKIPCGARFGRRSHQN